MTTISLRFAVRLHNSEIKPIHELYGPLFHRWLPNGESDALAIASTDADIGVRVWFEQRGYLGFGELIRFDYQRREVDEALVEKQAILDAGPLRGLLTIKNIDQEMVTVLQEDKTGEQEYATLGKRVIKVLYPILSRLIDTLRVRFGQYWIEPLEKWDSRRHTLGAYCHGILHLKYSLDNGDQWREFIPDEPVSYGSVTSITPGEKTFSQYLTEDDWLELKDLVNSGYKPSLASNALITTHQLLDSGSYRQAFIEGVTALELALNELVRDRLFHNSALMEKIQSFWNLPLYTQVAIAASLTQNITPNEIEDTLEAIKTRNCIIHEGQQVGEEKKSELRSLLVAIAKLIPGVQFKLPSAYTGNNIMMTAEQWSQLLQG
ncbi:MAG: hypothetical protein R3C14_28025 [Caldilineaceae bacterium]